MTQLVQLQQNLPELHDAGYEVFAISNDSVERLAEFAEAQSITFPLLSDEDSEVIRGFGIMNTLIRPDEGVHMRWYGIPYPGTYVTDAAGVVVDKDFHQHHARRLSGRALLHRVLGTVPEAAQDAPRSEAATNELQLTAHLVDAELRLEVISTLVCRLRISDGLHLYAHGAPEAFTPASLRFDGPGLRFGTPSWPTPTPLEMPLLDMVVPVWTGEVTVSVPVTVTSGLVRLGHGLDRDAVEVHITCTYQACDDESCGLPSSVATVLRVPLGLLVEPDGIKVYVDRVEQDRKAR